MRIRNDGTERATLPFQGWAFKGCPSEGSIQLALVIEPGELSDIDLEMILDPTDPRVQAMLKDRNLRAVELPDRFQRILALLDH